MEWTNKVEGGNVGDAAGMDVRPAASGAADRQDAPGILSNSRFRSFCRYLVAFLIPAAIVVAVMAVLGITPFGDTSALFWDGRIQHKDYLGYVWDILHGEAGIEYSTGKSLGGRMMGILGFYDTSPLNLLLIFFEKSQIPLFVSLMIILRIGLCGVTSQVFIQKRFGLKAFPALLLSCAYALMEYNVYNCRNFMWLDGVIMLPLVCLGVYRAVHEKKIGLLTVSVAVAIISNWYTGYMVCLFSIFYCVYEYCLHTEMHPLKRFRAEWKAIARYAAAMVMGVLMSCVVLLPALVSLLGGKATNNTVELTQIIHFDVLHFFSGFELVAGVYGQDYPIVFCSGLMLLSAFCYFTDSRISTNERILSGVFALFLIESFCQQDLELLWTVYVQSSSYYFRFAFVVPFFMLVLSAQAWRSIEDGGVQKKQVAWAAGFVLAIFAVLYFRGDLKSTAIEFWLYMVFLVLVAIAIVLCQDRRRWLRGGAVACLAAMLVFELCCNTWYAFREYVFSSSELSDYVEQMEEVVDELDDLSDGSFYRFERNENYLTLDGSDEATCESLLFGYNSIEHYSSAYDADVDEFLAQMGYSDCDSYFGLKTETYWNSPMVLTDALLSIRYAVLDGETYGYEDAGTEAELPFEGSDVYENVYALPLGYNVSSDMGDVEYGEDPYANQEALLSAMLGEDASVYQDAEVVSDEIVDGDEVLVLRATGDGPLYLYIDSDENHQSLYSKNCEVYVDGELLQECCTRFEINSMLLGDFEEGDEVEVRINRNGEDLTRTHSSYAVQLDEAAFEEVMAELSEGYESDLVVDSGVVSGTYSTDEDTTVFLSIPYEDCWTLYIDGEEAEYRELGGCFIGFDLTAGEHEIYMVYSTPGLDEGAVLSVAGVSMFAVYEGVTHVRRRRRAGGDAGGAHTPAGMQ